ncbi:DNA repair protein RadA [Candidatus Dojkabacteria bacterium]|uniref:DNA repair protein RadA n=1 Tax=Candidatus Dojkabacteria bacterium TaxID=2099670 RepID=A0A955KZ55_9BACT|nr:DNA repair protein RadA [Candidatus Dojkabacteria bacterium]
MAKTLKTKQVFVCSECGAEYSKWMGKCTACGSWDSLTEQQVMKQEISVAKQMLSDTSRAQKLGEVQVGQQSRLQTGFRELDTVLSGGLVDSQVTLLSGEPGIGKSTLLLQLLVNLSRGGTKCLYASGEESAGQVALRAGRLFGKKDYADIDFVLSPSVENLLDQVQTLQPTVVVVDSIQTIYRGDVSGMPGGLAQIKASTAALVGAAKSMGFTLILVGHINKDGDIAGPKVLEHLVDTVLRFEGEREMEYRILRVLKNRFGTTGEVGLFEMTERGLVDVDLKNGLFDGDGQEAVGAVKTMVLEGTRPIVVQVQALTNNTVFPYPKRVAEGLSISRLQLICAILDRFAGTHLGDKDVYVRTAGGYSLQGTNTDLAVAAAILSSVKNAPVAPTDLFVGELSLSGRVSLPGMLAAKLRVLDKFGVSRVWTSGSKPGTQAVKLKQVSHLRDLASAL